MGPSKSVQRFEQLSVVEVAGSIAGAFAAKLLAGLGAQVTVVEGSPDSRDAPSNDQSDGIVHAADLAARSWFGASKSFVTTGNDPQALAERVSELAQSADVLIESSAPGPLRPLQLGATLRRPNPSPDPHPNSGPRPDPPGLVRLQLSPFSRIGPYGTWLATDIIDQAIGGHLYLSGDPLREPLQGPADQAALAAGVYGAIGVIAALHARRQSGRGATIEVAHHEVLAALHQFTELKWTHGGEVLRRMGNRYAGPGNPIGMYRAADKPIALTVATADHMETLLAITGLDHLKDRPDVESIYDIMVKPAILDPPLQAWLSERTAEEAVELLQAVRLASAPVLTMHQLLEDPHLADRNWWDHLPIGDRDIRVPGPPFHISGRSWRQEAAQVMDGAALAAQRAEEAPAASPPTSTDRSVFAPLKGLRVLDLTRVWAGPLATRILADLGADVVMVEAPWARGPRDVPTSYVDASRFFPDNVGGQHPWNRNGFINKFAINKRSVALDIGEPEGKALFERLVAEADVVVENYSPRVMPNFGFDEARLRELNPHIIYITMPGYGRTGPAKDYSAYGPVLDSHAGLSTLMGYEGLEAWKCGIAWPDPVAGIHGALAALAALWDRESDPDRAGRTVEVAQFETAVTMIGNRVAEAQLVGSDPPLPGNRHPRWVPQGVYPCEGDDRWIAISVTGDDAWRTLCRLADLPAQWAEWSDDRRRANHDGIDQALAAWTAAHEHRELASRLQACGIAAAPVVDGAELVEDPQLEASGAFVDIDHPEAGCHPWPRLPIVVDGRSEAPTRPAPLLGQHNREVARDWAGLTADEIDELEQRGVLATEPPS